MSPHSPGVAAAVNVAVPDKPPFHSSHRVMCVTVAVYVAVPDRPHPTHPTPPGTGFHGDSLRGGSHRPHFIPLPRCHTRYNCRKCYFHSFLPGDPISDTILKLAYSSVVLERPHPLANPEYHTPHARPMAPKYTLSTSYDAYATGLLSEQPAFNLDDRPSIWTTGLPSGRPAF